MHDISHVNLSIHSVSSCLLRICAGLLLPLLLCLCPLGLALDFAEAMAQARGESPNGKGYLLPVRSKPNAPYPEARKAGGLIFVSGASSRLPVNSPPHLSTFRHKLFFPFIFLFLRLQGGKGFVGATATPWGVRYNVEAQTETVLENIRRALNLAGASLEHVVQTNCFLVDMRDMEAFNRAYGRVFNKETGPVRTTGF